MKTIFSYYSVGASWILIPILFSLALTFSKPVYAQEPWVGLFFCPQANTNNSHDIFLKDFESLVKTLKVKGVNTIGFEMNYHAYHFTSDTKLSKASYPLNNGFTPAEAHRMAEIVRRNGMQIVVSHQILTHSVGHIIPEVYPEYMLPGKIWQKGKSYSASVDYVQYNGITYRCVTSNISAAGNSPPAKDYWVATPSETRDPFNKKGEATVFKMIDELIAAFTVNGIKPEGFHIGSDELEWWYDNPEKETGMSSAQIYAMAITNAYNHIKAINPDMEVIMWGDMLDPYRNGAPKSVQYNLNGRSTAAAIDLIPKGLIIADWRYNSSQHFRYDTVREVFPSVGEIINKGFRVWPTSWSEVKGTTDLVWTGNMTQARSGKVMGHLYGTWLPGVVPELKSLLTNPNYQVPDSVLSGVSATNKSTYRQYYRGLADSINATSNLVGLKQCRGTDYYCGAYPHCEDNTTKSNFYGNEFHGFYCSNNVSTYKIINFPTDYVGYWKFNGDATDVSGRNNGTMMNGATIVKDATQGQVLNLAASNDYVKVKNNDLLNVGIGSLSIGAWFKAGASSELGTIVSKDPDFKCYNLFLHQDGRIWFETNGNNFWRYSTDGISYRDDKWHHVVAIFDTSIPTINIYIDGIISNGTLMFLKGSNIKSSDSDLFIGNNNGSGQYSFQGSIDDLVIFNRVLSAAEAKMLYASKQLHL